MLPKHMKVVSIVTGAHPPMFITFEELPEDVTVGTEQATSHGAGLNPYVFATPSDDMIEEKQSTGQRTSQANTVVIKASLVTHRVCMRAGSFKEYLKASLAAKGKMLNPFVMVGDLISSEAYPIAQQINHNIPNRISGGDSFDTMIPIMFTIDESREAYDAEGQLVDISELEWEGHVWKVHSTFQSCNPPAKFNR